jgi:hypothetical protein
MIMTQNGFPSLNAQTALELAIAFSRAMVEGDVLALERLLAPDFVYTHTSARLEPASELIASVRNGRKNGRMDFEQMSVRFYAATAIVSGLCHMFTSTKKRFDARFNIVVVMLDGAWRLAMYHSTRLPEA